MLHHENWTIIEKFGNVESWIWPFFNIVTTVSNVFYILTAFYYLRFWKEQSFPMKLHFFYIISMILVRFSSQLLRRFTTQIKASSETACVISAISYNVLYFMTYAWITSLTFDMWRTFRSGTVVSRNRRNLTEIQKSKEVKRRLFNHFAFTLTVSFSINAFAVVVDFAKRDNGDRIFQIIPPGFGKKYCYYFSTDEAALIYCYGFVGIISLVNLVMFVDTLRSIRKTERGIIEQIRIRRLIRTNSWKKFARLFILMEFTWTFELIPWSYYSFFYGENEHFDEIFPFILFPFDVIFYLSGVFVFVIIATKNIAKRSSRKSKSTNITNTCDVNVYVVTEGKYLEELK